jgi:archaellin
MMLNGRRSDLKKPFDIQLNPVLVSKIEVAPADTLHTASISSVDHLAQADLLRKTDPYRSMFAANEDHDIFEDPHTNGDDSLRQLEEEPDDDDSIGPQYSELEIKNLTAHQKSQLVKDITTRVAKTIHQFEDSRDEIGDLRVLEDQANREEVTRMIKKQERRAKKLEQIQKDHAKAHYEGEQHEREHSWHDEEAHIIDEQHLMSVEIDQSQRSVDGLLHLCDENRTGAVENLSEILVKLENIVEEVRLKSIADLENQGLRASGASSVVKDQMHSLKEIVETLRNEKIDLEYRNEQYAETLASIKIELTCISNQLQEKNSMFNTMQQQLTAACGKVVEMESQTIILNDIIKTQELDLAGMASMQKEAGRTADLQTQLKVYEARLTKQNDKLKELMIDQDKQIKVEEHLKKTIDGLESRLEEEKEITARLNEKRSIDAKIVADMGSNHSKGVADIEMKLKLKYTNEIDKLKTKINEQDVRGKNNLVGVGTCMCVQYALCMCFNFQTMSFFSTFFFF